MVRFGNDAGRGDRSFRAGTSVNNSRLPGSPRVIIGVLALLLILPAGWWFRLGATVGSPEGMPQRASAGEGFAGKLR